MIFFFQKKEENSHTDLYPKRRERIVILIHFEQVNLRSLNLKSLDSHSPHANLTDQIHFHNLSFKVEILFLERKIYTVF
jgi:hypothetical protein